MYSNTKVRRVNNRQRRRLAHNQQRQRLNHQHHPLAQPLVDPLSTPPKTSHQARKTLWGPPNQNSPGIELMSKYRPPSSDAIATANGVRNHTTMVPTSSNGQYAMPISSSSSPSENESINMIQNHHMNSNNNPSIDLSWTCFSHGCWCIQCVRTQEIGIVENCGAFDEIIGPGLYLAAWPFSGITRHLSLKVQQLDITCETKTIDNVFLHITVCVQYRVIAKYAYEACYTLMNVRQQMETYVYSVIRSTIPDMTLDNVFESKTTISDSVFTHLQRVMKDYGYEIVAILVNRISPNELVKVSMNEMNACKRLKDSMPYRAEADKINKVKQAEGRAETQYLHGIGVANQRHAIAQGMKTTVKEWKTKHPGYKSSDVLSLLLLTQYMDTLAAVGSNSLILRTSPSEVLAMAKQKNTLLPAAIDNSIAPATRVVSTLTDRSPPDLLS